MLNPIYEKLSSIRPLSRSYTVKFLFIAFLGIHIPLISLIVLVLFRPDAISAFNVLLLTLLMTLSATSCTLYVLNGLLAPLRRSRQALQEYIDYRTPPQLPVHFADEAGELMRYIQLTLTELNDLLEEKKDLISLLSHDLRTPLRNIKTFAGFLEKASSKEDIDEIARVIKASVEEQSAILHNVLDMLQQDQLLHTVQQNMKLPVAHLVEEAIESFDSAANAKGIALRKEIHYDGEVEVQPELFRQVLKNLASNAIKFSHEGAEVKFTVYRKADKTFIDITDKGVGFRPEVSETLFERFTKNGRMGTAGEPSMGIGLYLSRKIIRQHKGDIIARSEGPGKGSVFSISLHAA